MATKGPKKVRTRDADNKIAWVLPDDLPAFEAKVARQRAAAAEAEPAPEPAPEAEPAPAAPAFEPYYHPYLPNLYIHRGRRDQVRFQGGVYVPKTPQQEANVRQALTKYVPGRNPDRWKGDNLFDRNGNVKEQRCRECGFFTGNSEVMDDHLQWTKHG